MYQGVDIFASCGIMMDGCSIIHHPKKTGSVVMEEYQKIPTVLQRDIKNQSQGYVLKNFAKKWAPRLEFNQNLMVDIIDDTVAFYSFDVTRRATDVNVPQLYVTEDGRRSAVGR